MPMTKLKIVFGAMTFGRPDAEQTRVHDLKDAAAILDVFQKHGHGEVDTARTYGNGSSEEYLGQLELPTRGITLDTKLAPGSQPGGEAYTHRPADLKPALLDSLKALNTDKVDLWYLHAPDRSVPYEDTLREVNSLYEQGYFARLGISNYAAWEVAQMAEICIRNQWKRPDVYQGVYNALHRAAEPELFPCLRHYGIAFYAYNPLAGGLLTDRYERTTADADVEPGSRFDPARDQGANYRTRYWKDEWFDALDIVRPAVKAAGIKTTAEAALRWVVHHGVLDSKYGDAVIIGATSAAQLEDNLTSLEQSPLPEAVVKAFDEAWPVFKPVCKPYYRV